MAAVLRALLASPLGEAYELEVDPTYRGSEPLDRLFVFVLALLRMVLWRLRGRGRVVHIHATVRGSAYRKAICVLVAKASGLRVVLQFHSGAGDIRTFAAGLGPFADRFLRFAFGRADSVLAVSAASADALRDSYVPSPIEVVPNPAPKVRPPVERDPDGDEVPLLVYLGGFANPVKGGDVLLATLGRLPKDLDLRVVLAGPGELPSEGRAFIAAGASVEWRGWLEGRAKDELLRQASLFVLPSRSEGLPMALLEAMAYSLPIVATAVGGVPEVVEDGVEALLVPPDDPEALAKSLARIAREPGLGERLGAAAHARAESLAPEVIASRLGAVYVSLGADPAP